MRAPTPLWACVQKPLLRMCAQIPIPNRPVPMPLPRMRTKATGVIWLAGLPRAANKPGPPLQGPLMNGTDSSNCRKNCTTRLYSCFIKSP
ncbi:hypothetical protein XELAEV_18014249mg [Xenopus laevis]|uniref:Uncharacterized protein n=1 Tax=Xenopus laevis TaxID=8355 RepID=A0A974DGF9_XENLA|nr:hypothetical protein XELAEV_18014249mg [Xenopus laevis]